MILRWAWKNRCFSLSIGYHVSYLFHQHKLIYFEELWIDPVSFEIEYAKVLWHSWF